ncbi:hypothetical protein H2202_008489 [Exophiala xenobiotica]|nr:hypothetical protein H2202_008489 [Exophiala xenobiotica]
MRTEFEVGHFRLQERVERIERQLARLEHAVSAILERLERPSVHELNSAVEGAGASPTQQAENIQFSNAPYSYRPLDLQNSEIRLLALNTAGKNTDELSGQLVHVSLDDEQLQAYRSKEFNALSYVWGEPKMDRPIYIDGHTWKVHYDMRESRLCRTDKALRELLHLGIGGLIKSVSLMRRVYKKAAAVKIWLGDAIEGSSTAMEIVQKIGSPPTRGPGEKEVVYPSYSKVEISKHWDAMRLLLERQWWKRCWIRQEVVLASSPVVSWGDSSCRLDTILQAVMAMEFATTLGYRVPDLHKSSEPLRYNFYHHADDLRTLRIKSYEGHDYIPLHDLMLASRDCQATDLRDKVFSMLGLADPEVYDIRADYRLPLPEVLKIAARKILPQEGGLQLLGACQNPERRHELPSWVPNLIEQWRYDPFEPTPYGTPYAAPHGPYLMNYQKPAIEFDGDTLLVQGFIFHNITDVFEVGVTTNATDEQLDVIYTEWRLFSDANAHRHYGDSKLDRDQAWIKTFCLLMLRLIGIWDGYMAEVLCASLKNICAGGNTLIST